MWHLPGPQTVTTRALLDLVAVQVGHPVGVRSVPKLAVRVLGLINPMMRGLAEMSYQFDEPFVLDTSRYRVRLRGGRHPAGRRHRRDRRLVPDPEQRAMTEPKAMNAMTSPASRVKPASRSVFDRWGRTAYRRRRLILVIALLVAVVGGVWGTTIFAKVQTAGGFNAPDSQSQHEANLATAAFGRDAGDVVVLYSSPTLTTASPAFRSAVTSTLAALPRSKAESYATYWSTGSRQFVSASGHQTYAVIELTGATDTARQTSYDAIKTALSAPGLRSQVGGVVPTDETIDQQVTASITRAEGLSFPILLILLLMIFGSLTAACLPLVIGGLGILGSFTVLRLLTIFTGVSVFSLNITTILGLGLGIDYGLFMVTRFREELHKPGTGAGRGRPHRGHGGPDGPGLRRHRRDRAGQLDAVPRALPALDGLWRRRHRAGRHARRAHRAAGAAGRARARR